VGGLSVQSEFEQEIDPWNDKIKSHSATFLVQDYDGNDVIGELMFARGAGDETTLETAADNNDTTIVGADNTNFEAEASIYIGCECMTGATRDGGGTDFTGVTRGAYHPFKTNGGAAHKFGRNHSLPAHDYDVFLKPKISDAPRTWVGKWVSLHMHRVAGTTIDTRANAQEVFAGKIVEIQDTESGHTAIICDDVKSVVKNKVLLDDQFAGRIAEGVWLAAGWQFEAEERLVTGGVPDINIAGALVVTDGAAGFNQIEDGYNTTPDLETGINAWLGDESLYGDSATLTASWSFEIISTDEGYRSKITARWNNGTVYDPGSYIVFRAPRLILTWLGFTGYGYTQTQGTLKHFFAGTNQTIEVISENEPLRVGIGFGANVNSDGGRTLTLDGTRGTWVNNATWMPPPWDDQFEDSGDNIGFLLIGKNSLCIAKNSGDDTDFTVYWGGRLAQTFGRIADTPSEFPALTMSDGGHVDVRQMVILSGNLKDLIARFFAGTGTDAYNHATYDDAALGAQLGCAIPYELLGSAFELSLDNMMANTTQNTIMVVLEKPTKLENVLIPELLLRNSHLVWKNQGLRFVRPQSPTISGLALHTLTEDNKAGRPGDALRAPTQIDRTHLRNVFKFEFNRTVDGKYLDTITARFAASIDAYGESRPVTIKCRNSYGLDSETIDTVETNIADMLALVAPLYGRPMAKQRRTVDLAYWENVAPGDLVTVTDSFIRSPASGSRGITTKPGVIIAHRWQPGGANEDMFGEVDILFQAHDNVTVYAPTAMVDDTAGNSGYAEPGDGIGRLTVYPHEHSESSEAVDESHFVAGDKVDIIEIDPADEAAPTSWTNREVDAIDTTNHYIDLTATLAGWDAAKYYRVVATGYANAVATQKTDAFQADDSDMRIVDSRDPYEYGDYDSTIAFTASAATELPERYADAQYGDGVPLASSYHRASAIMLNNLVSYRTAIQMPMMLSSVASEAGTTYTLVFCAPYFIGPGMTFGLSRLLKIAPMLSIGAAGTGTCRVTISKFPPSGSALTTTTYAYPYKQLTFTTTSNGTYEIATAQTVSPVTDANGVGWVSVELKSNDGEVVCLLRGLAEFRLLELA
jgi:hypothetical protein